MDKKIKFSYIDYGKKQDKNRKIITKNFFKGIKLFTLQNVINAFFIAFRFHTYPSDADKIADDLEE